MGKDVIIACDFSSAQQTFDFLDKFTEEKPFVKNRYGTFLCRRSVNSKRN